MGKRVIWVGGTACGMVLLAALAGSGARTILRRVIPARVRAARTVLRRPVLATASAAQSISQPLAPRDKEILKPPRLDAWQIVGPGGGGTFYFPAVSPHDPNLVFVSTDMTECYVSENGGRTWRQFNLRFSCRIVFDPRLPNRVYALSSGMWRSDDRGRTWSLVYPEPAKTQVWYVDDEAEVYLTAAGGYPQGLSALAVDPDDSNILYASVESELRVSRDAGGHWQNLAANALFDRVIVDPTSPRDKRVLYLARGNVLAVWDGATLSARHGVEGGSECHGTDSGVPTGGGKPVIYSANDYILRNGELSGGILVSGDGVTWRSLNAGLLKILAKDAYPEFSAIATSAKHAEVIYVSATRLLFPNDPNGYFGVVKSTDGGATWTVVRKEAGVMAENMHDSWIGRRFGPDWGDEPLGMAVGPHNPDLIYTSDLGRVMRSVDGGKNWDAAYSQSTGKGYTTNGLDVTTCYGIHFDPFDPKRMFISYTDIGLMRSEDGGESWVSATVNGVPRDWRANTYWVEFDPAVKGKMWAVMSKVHDVPRHRMLNRYGGGGGGVVVSVDGGNTWAVSNRGLPPTMVPTHILLDPKSPVEARALYIAVFGKGVFKSTDGGQSWVSKNHGLPEKEPLAWRMAMDRSGTLYLVTIRRSEDGKYGNDGDGVVFRSHDGAESWERVGLPPTVNGPVGITVDPQDPNRLYVAAWARYTLYGAGALPPDGGVFLSADGGAHWENVLDGSRRIYDVTVDPRNPNLVYAAGFEASAWRSADRGKTWSRIRGFNFRLGHRVIPDPVDSSKIYITTFGSSVWHGPAAGDPSAVEDIVAPRLMMFNSVSPKSEK